MTPSRATTQWLLVNAPTTSSTCLHGSPEPTAQVITIKSRRLSNLLQGIARCEQIIIHINSYVSLSVERKTIDYLQDHCFLCSHTWASLALILSPTIIDTTQAVSIRVHQTCNINICTLPIARWIVQWFVYYSYSCSKLSTSWWATGFTSSTNSGTFSSEQSVDIPMTSGLKLALGQ
jgi:hypothetical protein